MPPRYTYWTIILEGTPTAFRARTQDELVPTLKQLQARHPDAVMKWFARGRLWASEEEAREAYVRKRAPQDRRGPEWRPGGAHEDPRATFKIPRDEKRRRFRERLFRDHGPGDREVPAGGRPDRPPRPDGERPRPTARPWSKDRPPAKPWSRDRPPAKPWSKDRPPSKPWSKDRPPSKPWSKDRPPAGGGKAGRPSGSRGGRGSRPPGGGGRRSGGGNRGGGGRGGSAR